MPRRREVAENPLTRTEPSPFAVLRREFASLFERAFPTWPFTNLWEMPEPEGVTMEEGEKEVVVRAEVPGFEPNEIEVEMHENLLTIRAEHKEEKGEAAERRHARLERTVTLPAGIEPEKVEARYRNGVLEVHVPLPPEALPRRIEVKT
jgi:HSP20 family protein